MAILYLPHTDHVIARLRIVNSTPMWFDLERTNSSLERRVFLGVSHALSQRDRRLSVPPPPIFLGPYQPRGGRVSTGSCTIPIPREWDPRTPEFSRPATYIRQHGTTHSDQIWRGDQTR